MYAKQLVIQRPRRVVLRVAALPWNGWQAYYGINRRIGVQYADQAMMRIGTRAVSIQGVNQHRGHLGISEHAGALGECQVGGDDHAGALVGPHTYRTVDKSNPPLTRHRTAVSPTAYSVTAR